jgi:hypothetical protein
MFGLFLRILWRLLIFALGVSALGLIVSLLWPESNGRFAIFITLLITYCLMAYLVVPNLMRLFHVFSKPDHIPLYVTTGDGWPSDPVNISLVVNSQKDLEAAMAKAGWDKADPLTFSTGLREVISIVFNRPYTEAPLSNLYLFDRQHDIGFEISTNGRGSARTRHHVRFWRLEEPSVGSRNETHYHFWQEKLRHMFTGSKEIWVGAATEETKPIDIQWRTGRLTHGGSHDSDKERDFIIQTLQDNGLVKKVYLSEPGEQLRFRGQQFRTFYISDGSIKIARLK